MRQARRARLARRLALNRVDLANVPYSSSSPWINKTGQSMPPRNDSMFQSRNSGASQISFQPRKAESTSA